MKIEIARADEATFNELEAFLLPMAREVALAPYDHPTARENGYRTLAEGDLGNARDGQGSPLVFTLARTLQPLGHMVLRRS